MNDLLRKLPIGIQTFEKLRKGDYLYVDKTELVCGHIEYDRLHGLGQNL